MSAPIPMLAGKLDLATVRFPAAISPKLDGIRCLISNGSVLSRKLKPIPNAHIQRMLGREALNGLDGELIVGSPTAKDCYSASYSGVMSQDGEPDFMFYVFDKFDAAGGFISRYREAAAVARAAGGVVKAHTHCFVSDMTTLLGMEETWLSEGYEGVMLRDPDGPYKPGRSTTREGFLLKLKRFVDAEAVIIGFEELMHNANEATLDALNNTVRSSHKDGLIPGDTLGAMYVQDVDSGVEFRLGTGFTSEQRQSIWRQRWNLVGSLVKYKHFEVGRKDKPRFPTFVGFRHPIDT